MINRYSLTKTETVLEGGLDPTGEATGVVDQHCREASTCVKVQSVKGGGILGHGAEQKCTSRSSVFSENVTLRRA